MSFRYNLPEGENSLSEQFHKLCDLQPVENLPVIQGHVDDALTRLRGFETEYLGPNMKLAESLVRGCNTLLQKYPKLPEGHKKLAMAAIRYFVIHMDTLPDSTPLVGLDDDALVLNFVFERLGMPECFVIID